MLHPGSDPGEDWNGKKRGMLAAGVLLHPGSDPGEDWNTSGSLGRKRCSKVAPGFRPG